MAVKMTPRLKKVMEILRQESAYLYQAFHVSEIGIFGSVARGDDESTSDVDLLLSYEEPLGWEIVDLGDYLEAKLGCPVDMVTKKWVRPHFWPYIEEDLVYV